MPAGLLNIALVAGPPSPQESVDTGQEVSEPAKPIIVPTGLVEPPHPPATATTQRTRLSPVSAMYTLPLESTATPCGPFNFELIAGPPSPHFACGQGSLMPATVERLPDVSTLRTELLPASAI